MSRNTTAAIITVALWCFSSTLSAQVPQLAQASTATGQTTTAKFHAGTTSNAGSSYGTSFAASVPISILAEIRPESSHVNRVGNLYLLLVLGSQTYMQVTSGNFELWDGTVAKLKPLKAGKTLLAIEPITVVQNVAFGTLGLAGTSLAMYLAYDTVAAPGQLYYSGAPMSLTVQAAVSASFQLFSASIATPIIQNRCIACHVSGGLAAGTPLVYVPSATANSLQINYDTIINYLKTAPNAASLILSKPQGLSSHLGGTVLSASSSDFASWSQFVSSSLTDIAALGSSSSSSSANIFSAIVKTNAQETLRKAALLFAGRLPTTAELATVANANDTALAVAVRKLMTGTSFEKFLMESANNHLLTKALSTNLFSIVDQLRYPGSMQYYQTTNNRAERTLVAEALADEPLRLITNVVTNERPYTEVLTADYIMLNPYSAKVYGGNLTFTNPTDVNEWRQGKITEYYRCTICGQAANASYNLATVYPHAGLLSSPAVLARFPSTSTNRNRARARWAYYFFLGVDIEGLADRTTDPAALADTNNPTLNNANCTGCHDIMDPVAGAFQNHGDRGFYRDQPGGLNSLPGSYRNANPKLFQNGDTWYADMLDPGFGTKLAPSADTSLQWLAQEFINDPRFGYGTVYFWYSSVIGRDPYAAPENPEDADYSSKLAAYSTEQTMLQSVAQRFVAGSAGNGKHNLKDLLVDLVMSEHFRANSVTQMTSIQAVELEEIGTGKLLTPEQLNRKMIDVTGFNWRYGTVSALESTYGLIYGGIDSLGITIRATDLTTLMSSVVSTMANEVSCSMVAQDFGRTQSQRKLFPNVELTTLPTTNPTAIRTNIQHLHRQLLGEELAATDAEINATFTLFQTVWNARIAAKKGSAVNTTTEVCIFEGLVTPVRTDANQTLRSWAAVVNYLIRDYKFIHE